MKGDEQPRPDKALLEKLPKAKLIAMIIEQREETRVRLEEKDRQSTELSEQVAKLQGEIDQRTSKRPEWDGDCSPRPTTKGKKGSAKGETATTNRGKPLHHQVPSQTAADHPGRRKTTSRTWRLERTGFSSSVEGHGATIGHIAGPEEPQ